MVLALDGHGSGNNAAGLSATVTYSPATTNDTLYCLAGLNSGATAGVTISTIADGTNTWAKRNTGSNTSSGGGNNCDVELWSTTWASSGSITLTITVTGVVNVALACVGWGVSGGPSSSQYDTNASSLTGATGTSNSPSATVSTSNANDFLISAQGQRGRPTPTLPTNFTIIDTATANTGTAATSIAVNAAYQVVSATQSALAETWTGGTAFNWNCLADAVIQSSAAGSSSLALITGAYKAVAVV